MCNSNNVFNECDILNVTFYGEKDRIYYKEPFYGLYLTIEK